MKIFALALVALSLMVAGAVAEVGQGQDGKGFGNGWADSSNVHGVGSMNVHAINASPKDPKGVKNATAIQNPTRLRDKIKDQVQLKNAERVQNRLMNSTDRIMGYLGHIRERVNASVILSLEQKNRVGAQLGGYFGYFDGFKDDIDSAEDLQDLRNLSSELRNRFRDVRAGLRVAVGNVWTAHLDEIISRLENVSARLRVRVDEIAANGTDTSELEGLLGELDRALAGARANADAAEEKLSEITGWDNAQELFHEAKVLVGDAMNKIVDSRDIIRDIIKEIKQASGGHLLDETGENNDSGEAENESEED